MFTQNTRIEELGQKSEKHTHTHTHTHTHRNIQLYSALTVFALTDLPRVFFSFFVFGVGT